MRKYPPRRYHGLPLVKVEDAWGYLERYETVDGRIYLHQIPTNRGQATYYATDGATGERLPNPYNEGGRGNLLAQGFRNAIAMLTLHLERNG